MSSAAEKGSMTLTYVLVLNIILQLLMQEILLLIIYRSFSMHKIWGMMNTL
jgi:hypothetical protein